MTDEQVLAILPEKYRELFEYYKREVHTPHSPKDNRRYCKTENALRDFAASLKREAELKEKNIKLVRESHGLDEGASDAQLSHM